MHCGLKWEFPPFLEATDGPLQTVDKLPAIRAVQGDCGTVYGPYGYQKALPLAKKPLGANLSARA